MTISSAAWVAICRANRENAKRGFAPAVRWVIETDAPMAMYLYSLRRHKYKLGSPII